MTKEQVLQDYEQKLIARIERASKGRYVYDGEIFDDDMVSIEYIPDLIYDIATFVGEDDNEAYEEIESLQDFADREACRLCKSHDDFSHYFLKSLCFNLHDLIGDM